MDTSSLIDGERSFPQESNPELWQRLRELTVQRRMMIPNQVFDEISSSNKALYSWASERRNDLVVHNDKDLVKMADTVATEFPHLVDAGKIKPDADPYIIALAMQLQKRMDFGYAPIIVTEESDRPNKIPWVARHYGVPSTNFRGLLKREDWHYDGPAGV